MDGRFDHLEAQMEAMEKRILEAFKIHGEDLRATVQKAAEGYGATLQSIERKLDDTNRHWAAKWELHEDVLKNHAGGSPHWRTGASVERCGYSSGREGISRVARQRTAEPIMRVAVLTALVGVIIKAFSVSSQTPSLPPPNSVFLEDLTWTESRDAIAAGKTTVIVPTGGTEQNGPHMALGKHNYLVTYKAGSTRWGQDDQAMAKATSGILRKPRRCSANAFSRCKSMMP